VTDMNKILKISSISLFAYFFLEIRYVLGLPWGPPGRCLGTTGGLRTTDWEPLV